MRVDKATGRAAFSAGEIRPLSSNTIFHTKILEDCG
jgi:hypothetical protein